LLATLGLLPAVVHGSREREQVADLEVVDVPRRQGREQVAELDEIPADVGVDVVETVEVVG
jgi:hypothetical protein